MFNDGVEDFRILNIPNIEIKRRQKIIDDYKTQYKIGDVVILNSGGPNMTVIKVIKESQGQLYQEIFDESKIIEILTVRYLNYNGEFSTTDFDSRCVNQVNR